MLVFLAFIVQIVQLSVITLAQVYVFGIKCWIAVVACRFHVVNAWFEHNRVNTIISISSSTTYVHSTVLALKRTTKFTHCPCEPLYCVEVVDMSQYCSV